jgi:hypothetical protein
VETVVGQLVWGIVFSHGAWRHGVSEQSREQLLQLLLVRSVCSSR